MSQRWSLSPDRNNDSGFTLVEVVISIVILMIFAITGLAINSTTIATLNQAQMRAEALQGVQIDLEAIRRASLDFCRRSDGGYGPTNPSSGQSCQSPHNTWVDNFTTACDRTQPQATQLGTKFQQYLESITASSPITYTAPSGKTYAITRTIETSIGINGTNLDVTRAGRTVTIRYTAQPVGSNLSLTLTTLTVVPVAAGFCPLQYV